MELRSRASLHSVPYLLVVLVVLPWAFAWALGSGPVTARSLLLGAPLILAGFALSGLCVSLLVKRGAGTQSPLEPTKRLVIAGPYRYARNPMILGNLLLLAGEAVVFASPGIGLYALLFWATWHVILVQVEEPSLGRRFGSEYESYRQHVPRWLPRLAGGAC